MKNRLKNIGIVVTLATVPLFAYVGTANAAPKDYSNPNNWGDDGESLGGYNFDYKDHDPDEFGIEALSWQRYLLLQQNSKNN